MDEVCKLGREMKFEICQDSCAYPEKFFYTTFPHNFLFDYLFMCHPDLPDSYKELYGNGISYKPFEMMKNNTWFFDREKLITFEKLEHRETKYDEYIDCFYDSSIIKNYEKKTKKKFYPKELPISESIALISTPSIEHATDFKTDIDLKLNHFFERSTLFAKLDFLDGSSV